MDLKKKKYTGSNHICLQETHLTFKDTHKLKMNRWKQVFHANSNTKEGGVTILIIDKINFKSKSVIRHKEGHYIIPKE